MLVYQSRSVKELPLKLRGRDIWHKCAPNKLVAEGHWDSGSEGWQRWRKHLAGRERLAIDSVTLGERVAWSDDPAAEHDWLPLLKGPIRRRRDREAIRGAARRFVLGKRAAAPLPTDAVECLAWAYALPRLAETLDAGEWWDVLDELVAQSRHGAALNALAQPTESQLLGGELGLALAYLFPELKPCRKLAAQSRATLNQGVLDLLSPDGLLHAAHLAQLPGLMACWLRARMIGPALKRGCWEAEAEKRWRAAVRQSLRLLARDGRQLLPLGGAAHWPGSLVSACVVVGGEEVDARVARQVIAHKGEPRGKQDFDPSLPDPAYQSDSAEYAVLRTSWDHRRPLLAVDHSGPEVQLELTLNRDVLLRGAWGLHVRSDGAAQGVLGDWEAVCWVSDDDVVYLELQATLSAKWRVQRQVLLARKDGFLFLNDVLLGSEASAIEYRSTLDCAADARLTMDEDNTEIALAVGKHRLVALPLALPEWRKSGGGQFRAEGARLEYSLRRQCQSLVAPVFIDLNSRRRDEPLTWRQLTVAQQREILSADDAVGYRVHVAKKQWLFYRALATRGSRTVFGANLGSEFLASRMHDGELETLIEIE